MTDKIEFPSLIPSESEQIPRAEAGPPGCAGVWSLDMPDLQIKLPVRMWTMIKTHYTLSTLSHLCGRRIVADVPLLFVPFEFTTQCAIECGPPSCQGKWQLNAPWRAHPSPAPSSPAPLRVLSSAPSRCCRPNPVMNDEASALRVMHSRQDT